MTGRTFKLSTMLMVNMVCGDIATTGDNGTEYTTGKTTNGIAGSSGAYVQYAFAGSGVAETMYYYDGDTGSNAGANYGGSSYRLVAVKHIHMMDFTFTIKLNYLYNTDTFTFNSVVYNYCLKFWCVWLCERLQWYIT